MSGLAIASLVLSCLSVVPLPGPLGAVLGIVFGHIARRQISNDPNMRGAGVALAGLIVGYVFLAIVVLLVVMFLAWW